MIIRWIVNSKRTFKFLNVKILSFYLANNSNKIRSQNWNNRVLDGLERLYFKIPYETLVLILLLCHHFRIHFSYIGLVPYYVLKKYQNWLEYCFYLILSNKNGKLKLFLPRSRQRENILELVWNTNCRWRKIYWLGKYQNSWSSREHKAILEKFRSK